MNQVAIVQMVSTANVGENLKQAEKLLVQAKEQGALLAQLPENFAFMGMRETDRFHVAEAYGNGVIQDKIGQLAKSLKIWVIAGTLPMKTGGRRVRASCLVYDSQGACAARYDKIHLFDVRVSEQEAHQESLTIEPGNELVCVDTPVGKIGLSVCYDLRFPELFHSLQQKGAQLFSIPSAFTEVTGKAHWEVLLRARAIENLSYVLAANQGGIHQNGRHTYGHSMVVEPWGKVLSSIETGPGVIMAGIDLQRLEHLRNQFPSIQHHVLN
ncbi:carbon-nitrogen hydrolase family protein [Legionella waltersii]|uniref:Nitrilase n=1 Tax=Legionella waltersii TaxID=66969 RepID=A0A0W1AP33_9GAMM|nr:carbon-nitrogen hydrolase family protein [Legionella waltersii]KTD83010.1 nitrilase [Legionella waltersii]SNV07616.1 nitrilase [Legionella waltersii]